MKKQLIALLVAGLLIAGTTFAQPPQPAAEGDAPPCHPGKGKPGMMRQQIIERQWGGAGGGCCGIEDLTEAQEKSMRDLGAAHKRDMLKMKTDLESEQVALKLLITDKKYDQGKVDATITKISNIKKDMLIAKTKHQKAVRELLTDDQKVQFDNKILNCKQGPGGQKGMKGCKMGGKMGGGMGSCGGGGGPGCNMK